MIPVKVTSIALRMFMRLSCIFRLETFAKQLPHPLSRRVHHRQGNLQLPQPGLYNLSIAHDKHLQTTGLDPLPSDPVGVSQGDGFNSGFHPLDWGLPRTLNCYESLGIFIGGGEPRIHVR